MKIVVRIKGKRVRAKVKKGKNYEKKDKYSDTCFGDGWNIIQSNIWY